MAFKFVAQRASGLIELNTIEPAQLDRFFRLTFEMADPE
jgi:hypothetical protein